MKFFYITAKILILAATLSPAAEVRSWTDVKGRELEASLIKTEENMVSLKLTNGKEVYYPIEKLSVSDQAYIKKLQISIYDPTNVSTNKTDGLNFDAMWPERISYSEDPEVNTIEENAEKKRFIYESENYRYTCDVRLSKSVVKGFAVMFEATYLYCRKLPLALNGGKRNREKNEIFLYEFFDNYVKAGGPPSSGGVFLSGTGIVAVPLTSLGVKSVGDGYMFDRDKSNNILSHELAHQLTPDSYYSKGALGWFTEGLAEYVALTSYRSGSYNTRNIQKNVVDFATGYGPDRKGGRNLGTEIYVHALKHFMLQDYESFSERANLNYGCSLLFAYYFFHMDGDGDGKRIKTYLKALHDGKDGEKSLEILLDGRTFEELEQGITKAWSRDGVDFVFGKS